MTTAARERFREIVQPRLDEGYRLARWLTGSAADADDIVQEACLRAFQAIEGFVEGNARAWFLTIVRNTCHSWSEQRRLRPVVSGEDLGPSDQFVLDVGAPTAKPQPTPESDLIRKDEATRLAQLIVALPLHLRETLVLREYHDLSYREIAAVVGVPVGNVMSRLARARQHLLAVLRTGDR